MYQSYIKKEDRKKILDFLNSIIDVKYYDNTPELLDVKQKCFNLMGVYDEDFIKEYSLEIFNGFLDDYFSRGKNKFEPRFKYRNENVYLKDGTLNPRRFQCYWSLF